jgi:hypothetical protein
LLGQSKLSLAGLTEALRKIGHPNCQDAALRLDASSKETFDLHLRHAGLTPQDAVAIAKALSNHGSSAPRLRSFSISYNRALSDEGATILLAALPLTLNALGMVECDLSDESGRTLLDWGQHATGLQMMCVEGNRFSPAMRQRLAGIGQTGSTPTVFA